LFCNQLEHIARLGDVRQINLGPDFVRVAPTPGLRWRGLRLSGGAKMSPHLLRFVLFDRTGVCLLLGHSDFDQDIQNRLALDFELPGQIVDSNLTHPPFLGPAAAP
jgi:hypothetical protein